MKAVVSPTSDNVLVEPIADEKSKGGIFLVESKESRLIGSGKGRVVAVGPGKVENGTFVETRVKAGATVYYHTYPSGVSVDVDGRKMTLIAERQVVGIING
jgi:chaperonin GroES